MRGSPWRLAHDLAVKLGLVDVKAMLDSISVHKWNDWLLYMSVAPFSEERADLRAAQICQALVNMWRDAKEHPKPFPIQDFLLKFGDDSDEPVKKKKKEEPQTVEEIQRHITDWVVGTNQVITEERLRGLSR